MSELFVALLIGLLAKVIIDEFGATIEALARCLVKRGARLLTDNRERYEEQWLADLKDRPTPTRKMLFALGVLWAATVLRREFAPRTKKARTDRALYIVMHNYQYGEGQYWLQRSTQEHVSSALFEKALAQNGFRRSKRVMLRMKGLYTLVLRRNDLTPEQRAFLQEFVQSIPEPEDE